MSQPRVQASFNSGEWAPSLYARVDIEKYRSAAALLKNFFVDYRGGASTRPGTKYILRCYDDTHAVRLIPFQASFTVSYVLEFGQNYIRFYNNGVPVLESTIAITGATRANPCVVSVANTYAVGDWVYITGVGGMTELNGHYFKITARTAGTITLAYTTDVAVNSTAFTAYTAGGTVQRIYTISSPYLAADLATLKFVQNVNSMILTHASYVPYVLTLNSATNWTLSPIVFGSGVGTPTGTAAATTLAAGTVNYAYIVTASDQAGQESGPSAAATLANIQDIRSVAGTNTITWNAVSGAASYNVYRAELSYGAAVPSGAAYGFIGNATGTSLKDSNIAPDFSVTPPVTQNPFAGASVIGTTITAAGAYTVAPTVTFAAPGGSGHTATGTPIFTLTGTAIAAGGGGYAVGNRLGYAPLGSTEWVITNIGGGGTVTAVSLIGAAPSVTGTLPTNPIATTTNGVGVGCTLNLTWGVTGILLSSGGDGYLAAPAISFSAGAATATALLGTASNGNPSVPGFVNQRLVLGGPSGNPQQFNMSQPGAYYNYNISNPIQEDDAITGQLASGQLNAIKSMVPTPAGLIMFTDRQNWLINGGANGVPVTPINISANSQSFIGANDIPPIVSNFDILFVQAKGSTVRDVSYNFYANVWTGTDISILSSHLFYGYYLTEWAWAEEPFKIVWAVRNDGTALSLTFLKEQEFTGWAHSITDGSFKSVCVVTETLTDLTSVDAVYFVVERTINSTAMKYIERLAERNNIALNFFGVWCVDSALRYSGSATTTLSGAEHLAGKTVTGIAEGAVITPFVMPQDGRFTLPTATTFATIGLAYTCDLQTLALDLGPGEATVQGKVKKISAVDVRVADTLALKIGSSFTSLVPMKDLVLGNVSSMLTGQATQVVAGLVTGDARTYLDPTYTVPGQYCIRQDQPYPATVLGVIPQVVTGDTAK